MVLLAPLVREGDHVFSNLDHARATKTDIVMQAQTAGMTKWDVEHIRTRLQRIPADGS